MSVQAWFSNDELEIAPGSTITLKLSVQNLGESTSSYTIVPSGLTANWITVDRGNVTLFAGSQDVIDVQIGPPRLPSTTAGPTIVGVRVIPTDDPDDTVVAETTLDVQPFDDRRIVALQPVLRARHRANFEFMVENQGNGLASCRLRLVDPSERIDGSFDPPAVGVAPGGASLVRFKSRARRGVFRRAVRTLDFEIEAEQAGHEPAAGDFSLVQPPTISAAAIGRVAAVALLIGAAALAWFGVVRPEIRDAAEERVDERLEQFQAVVDDLGAEETIDPDAPATTVPEDATGDGERGEPDFFRLSVSPSVTRTADDAFTVAEGERFDLTDVRVENANNDAGRAALSVNGAEVFTWSLSNIRGSFFEPRITPIRLEAGDNVTFSVRCDQVGSPSVGTCEVSVNVGGRTVDLTGDT